MLEHLRQFKISARLNIILVLIIIGFAIMLKMEHSAVLDTLLENKKHTPQSVVQVAVGVTEHYYAQVQEGSLSEEDAKRQALSHIERLRYDGSEYLWVNDVEHIMLMHPIKPALNGKNLYELKDPHGTYLFREFVSAVKNDGSGFVEYYWPKPGSEEPVHKVSYVVGFKPWGWVIGSGLYTDDVQALVSKLIMKEALSLGVVVLIIFGVLYMVMLSITRPIKNNVAMMNNIASGDGDLTQELSEVGSDETAELARDFNIFVRKLKNMMSNIRDSIDQLSSSSESLSAAANSSANCASQQLAETDQTASAINELSSSASGVAQSAELASETSQHAMNEASTGREVMANSLRIVSELTEEMSATRLTINQLHTETENIGSLLSVIRGIAEQTNLLALNAAIEAARAGEQGRGFAVVADEVRALAGKTQQATEEIDSMIAKLQEDAASSVAAMETSSEKTEQTKLHAQQADQALAKITDAISRLNDVNAQIATSSEQQSKVSEELNQGILNIVNISEENANNSKQVLNSAAALDEVRTQLNALAAQFKIH